MSPWASGDTLDSITLNRIIPSWYYGATSEASSAVTSARTLGAQSGLVRCDASTGAFTVTLPTATGNAGVEIALVKADTTGNFVTVATTSSQSISGSLTQTLRRQGEALTLVSDNTNWWAT